MKNDSRDSTNLSEADSPGGIGGMGAAMPARVAAASGGGILTATALKYSPDATVEDSYPTMLSVTRR